jgi:integrase
MTCATPLATLMLKAGVPTKDVSDRLGHSNVAITLDTYAHSMPDTRRDAAEALASMIRGTGT